MTRPIQKTLARIRSESEVPAVIADHQGLITHVNSRFEEVFGWTADQIIGEPINTIIPEAMRDAHNLGFSRFVSTGQATLLNQPMALRALHKDGRVFEVEVVLGVLPRFHGRLS